jgi:branched-chain amino acid transport system substrate-binding protein
MQTKRSSAHLATALLLAMVLVAAACGGDSKTASTTSTTLAAKEAANALGTPDKATGTPVKIGLITNGVGQGFDQHDDEPTAKAAANWINDYQGGIGGHPITLVKCVDKGDPSTAADCANELIRQNVNAVVYSSNGVFESSWRPLSAAGIPTFIQAVTGQDSVKEPKNTFTIQNGLASTVDGPIELAKKVHSKVFSVLSVDVPAATSNYTEGLGPKKIKDAGLELQLIAAPLGTPDLTTQTQQIVQKNPDGFLNILGNDAFCIAALNGLKAAGFTGTIAANEQCITDNTIKAVGGDSVKGIRVITNIPLAETDNPSTKLYTAVLQKWAPDVDPINGAFMFLAMTGLGAATRSIEDGTAITPDVIIHAAKTMPWTEQPGSGGRHMRCNGKADPAQPAVCQNGLLYGSLGADGKPTSYTVVNDKKIPD